jgi:hypothetical protein
MAGTGPDSAPSNPSGALGAQAGGTFHAASNGVNDTRFGNSTIQVGEHRHYYPPAAKDERTGGDSTVPSARYFVLVDLPSVLKLRETVRKPTCGQVDAFGVRGSGGVGKTRACTIVARRQAVSNLYKGARAWIRVGDGAAAETIGRQVAHIVKETAGDSCAKKLEDTGENSLDEVRNMARWWLSR